MSKSRFNYFFLFLMALAAIAAFALPPRLVNRASPQLQILFAPVSRPVRATAAALHGRGGPNLPPDAPAGYAIQLENERLTAENIQLRHAIEELSRINDDHERLGPLRQYCTAVAVVGGDPGPRDSLALQGSRLEGLGDGMYVLYPGDTGVQIVGQLQRSGVLGSQVRLITDPGFKVTVYFMGPRRVESKTAKPDAKGQQPISEIRFERLNAGPTPTLALAQGVGKGHMVCRQLKMSDVKAMGLQVHDRVVLDDKDWPAHLRGYQIGTVLSIGPRPDHPLFAEIRITPNSDLQNLREVMVLTKEK